MTWGGLLLLGRWLHAAMAAASVNAHFSELVATFHYCCIFGSPVMLLYLTDHCCLEHVSACSRAQRIGGQAQMSAPAALLVQSVPTLPPCTRCLNSQLQADTHLSVST